MTTVIGYGYHGESNDDGTHTLYAVCDLCGKAGTDETKKCYGELDDEGVFVCIECGWECSHVWEDGICTACDYECEHQNIETVYRNGGSGWHEFDEVCPDCNFINEDAGYDDCVDDDEDGYCDYCKAGL